mmetsp:Transcript_8343/g.30778  ORF Transcript_8343/g.30778 Transcript_8343/m.30778 type:complete len:242 (+) Transcript_8343:659-1384(+)
MLDGFTSRCTMPARWSPRSACSSCDMTAWTHRRSSAPASDAGGGGARSGDALLNTASSPPLRGGGGVGAASASASPSSSPLSSPRRAARSAAVASASGKKPSRVALPANSHTSHRPALSSPLYSWPSSSAPTTAQPTNAAHDAAASRAASALMASSASSSSSAPCTRLLARLATTSTGPWPRVSEGSHWPRYTMPKEPSPSARALSMRMSRGASMRTSSLSKKSAPLPLARFLSASRRRCQ